MEAIHRLFYIADCRAKMNTLIEGDIFCKDEKSFTVLFILDPIYGNLIRYQLIKLTSA
ncbi:hypothetical protein PAT3040_05681 [Paenibacillus agaridevorans]|uniref:Uncharacterized protein n=1 Tax=Paenibacillus agaridevorans TaxID=171404 RepID=A0A2R5F468_9BACL|nr:hypothetical protein PAT3040_05681 [Paenibacillus agaridevorans]